MNQSSSTPRLYTSPTTTSAATVTAVLAPLVLLLALYLWNLNQLLSTTPPEVARTVPQRWTPSQLREVYERLRREPITTANANENEDGDSSCQSLPPELARRYIVTGGSGLVGGHIVLQLLARGQRPEAIRIVDFQAPHRADMVSSSSSSLPVTKVSFCQADIASAASTDAAFAAPWPDDAIAALPLTVFHTAAVIIPSARSELVNGFCEAVNVQGTRNVLAAARRAGADVLVSTSSASIAIRPVQFWASPAAWNKWWWTSPHAQFPPGFWQFLDESDFYRPLRPHDDFFGNYPASKAKAERIVCAANSPEMRTGCIRPGNGVYGHPTDNLLGTPLSMQVYPTWVESVVQNFVHGINCAIAHLQFEAVLAAANADADSAHLRPQAGRPFCITDPGPPIYYGDMYRAMETLVTTPFRIVRVPPLPMLLVSYLVEWYNLLPVRGPAVLRKCWPRLPGSGGVAVAHLQPGLFSICTHLLTDMRDAQRPVREGGLGYRGVLTTLEGMCQEILDWNMEQEHHAREAAAGSRGPASGGDGVLEWSKTPGTKLYRTSVALAEEIQKLGGVGQAVKS